MVQLLAHGLGAADQGENPLLDVLPRLLLGEETAAVFEDRQGRAGRGVARWRQADVLEVLADEVPEVRLEFLAGLAVGLGDVKRDAPAQLPGLRLVARPG